MKSSPFFLGLSSNLALKERLSIEILVKSLPIVIRLIAKREVVRLTDGAVAQSFGDSRSYSTILVTTRSFG